MDKFNEKTSTYNKYVVNFINNQPLSVWAKDCITTIKDNIVVIAFLDSHSATKIKYINSNEVLFIEIKNENVQLY